MKNQLIRIGVEEADRYALDYFINICGFRNREGEKFKRMLDHGMRIREKVVDRVDMKAVVSSYDGSAISGNTAKLGDSVFICNAFEQLHQDSIQKIYVYLFTAGSFELNDDDPVIDQLYADIWGTAYTDAGLEVLKHHLKADFDKNSAVKSDGGSCPGSCEENAGREAVILEAFGPGYYGMDIDQIGTFFEVLDGDKAGVKARTNSLMLPLKSCAGFFVIMDDDVKLPSADCVNCRSDHSGCEYCQAVIKRNQ
ncbi:MAG TPA: hypothetical protein VN381_09585 [Anaerovoracaceae bacterium]|nr:hypothetical protein [Anaerovoracaceae bacterium]